MYCAVKIDFQDGRQGSPLGFPIWTILAIFDLQIITILPTKFRVNWPFRRSNLGFPIGMILAIFYLQVTSMLPT